MPNKIKQHFKEVLRIKTSPHSIAIGFAIGTFLAIFPTLYLAIIPAIIITLIFKKISKIALFAAFVIWSPPVMLSLFPFFYIIGDWILQDIILESQILSYPLNFVVGSTIFAIFAATISYILVFYSARLYQQRKRIALNK